MSLFKEFTKGLLKENPNLVMLLGMCPTLAITTMAINGLGMGLATTFVLICSNIVLSALKRIIPGAVRLPCFIVIIAGFVTFVSIMLESFIPSLYDSLGVFLALITVNCIILGRAEMFACKNKVLPSALDGAGMGLGFTLSLVVVGSVREILGTGRWFATEGFEGIQLMPDFVEPMTIFVLPAGAFFALGVIIAVVNKISKREPKKEFGCASCPSRSTCIGGGCQAEKLIEAEAESVSNKAKEEK